MTVTTGGGDAACPETPELRPDTAELEVVEMHQLGFKLKQIADTMRMSGYDPPPRRAWTARTVGEIIDKVGHIDVSTIPGGFGYRDPNAPSPTPPPEFSAEELELAASRHGYSRT